MCTARYSTNVIFFRNLFQMSSSKEPFSLSVISVYYGSVSAGLFHQERNAESYTPLENIQDLVLKMPDHAKRTLLEPIENGNVDPLSAYFKIQDSQGSGTVLTYHIRVFEKPKTNFQKSADWQSAY
jgi:hypothetical protein